MARKLAVVLSVLSLAGCASLDRPDGSNLAAYCTPENAFRIGPQARAYFGVCPKDTESAFLAGLARGRALRPPTPQAFPFYAQMEDLEKQLLAAPAEADREQIRVRLREVEWWAMEILRNPGTSTVN